MSKRQKSGTRLLSQYFKPAFIKPNIPSEDIMVRPDVKFRVSVVYETEADDESFVVVVDFYKGEDWTESQISLSPLVAYSAIPFGYLPYTPNLLDIAEATKYHGSMIEVVENIAEHAFARGATLEIEHDLKHTAEGKRLVLNFYLCFGTHVLSGELPLPLNGPLHRSVFEIKNSLLERVQS